MILPQGFPLLIAGIVVGVSIGIPVLFWMALSNSIRSLELQLLDRRRLRATAAGLLLVWLVGSSTLTLTGILEYQEGHVVPRFVLLTGASILAGVLLLLVPRYRLLIGAIPQHWLIGTHSVRIFGVIFLALTSTEVLPRSFAIPAGYGDIVIGVVAPFVARALFEGWRSAGTLAIIWNLLGMLDGVSAIRAAITSLPQSRALSAFPLVLLFALVVPILVLFHVYSVGRLVLGHKGTGQAV